MKIYETIHDAYLGSIKDVLNNYEYKSAPRGQPILEKTDYTFRILNPKHEPIITKDLERNETIKRYTELEENLYNSGTNKVEDFAKASKFWNKIVNPDNETINSAYGYLIWHNKSHGNKEFENEFRTPWEWAKLSLIKDKDTRQAILRFSLPEHYWMGNKDQVCTMHGNFQIRDNKLNLCINMRANDLSKGLVFDLPFFVSLIYKMANELKHVYPDLEIGHYTHIVHSIHIYERDIEQMKKMIKSS